MRAVALIRGGTPIDDPSALADVELPAPPPPTGRDLRVRVHAVSVNPRDLKSRLAFEASPERPLVLGYDASGVVDAVGPDCELFQPGDEVMYAGVLDRPGSNAELQLVDERIVGRKPTTVDHAAAASLPLTALTAYELLFDRMGMPGGEAATGQTLLVVGGAGGVASMAVQLAHVLTDATVVGTASRPESRDWVRSCGASHVLDHRAPLAPQVAELGLGPCRWVVSTHTTAETWADLAELLAPQGSIGLLDDPEPLDLRLLKFKSGAIHWEAMFTRPMFNTPDLVRQHEILGAVADLVDEGVLRPTVHADLGPLCAANLQRAHCAIAEGHVVGKLVLRGVAEASR